jgi:hypothetical protein
MQWNIQHKSENKSTVVPLLQVSKKAVCSAASPGHCPPFQNSARTQAVHSAGKNHNK